MKVKRSLPPQWNIVVTATHKERGDISANLTVRARHIGDAMDKIDELEDHPGLKELMFPDDGPGDLKAEDFTNVMIRVDKA